MGSQPAAESDEQVTYCWVCESELHLTDDEWWQHNWEENPAQETVEKAMEHDDFRDWFRENKVFCKDCHKDIIARIEYRRSVEA